MIPYGRHSVSRDDIEKVVDSLQSEFITTGAAVEKFEGQLRDLTQTETFVVSSGTAALHCAYVGAGVGPGDEVISSPMTFIATQSTAVLLGARIVFADIDFRTGLMSLDSVAQKITDRTKAIVVVDYAGQTCDIDAYRELIGNRNIVLIQDAAHSLGTTYKGAPVGSLADFTAFSFFPTKNITTGEGGAVSGLNSKALQRAKAFARQGVERSERNFVGHLKGDWIYEAQQFGLNYRLTDFQCALGLSQLERIETFKKARSAMFAFYEELLGQENELRMIEKTPYNNPMWHLLPVFAPKTIRHSLFRHLRMKGIGVQVNYIPTIMHPVFTSLGYRPESCPEALRFYEEEISLPLFVDLPMDSIRYVCETIVEFMTEGRGEIHEV